MTDTSHPTVFVGIAAYNDPFLLLTIDQCLANARRPQNLRFGICWQFDPEEPVSVDRFRKDKRFRFLDYPIEESQGGSWARNLVQELWEGETYSLQIDSHMVFAPGWDESLIRMMRKFPADRPLISTIVPLFRLDNRRQIHLRNDPGIRAMRMIDWSEKQGWAPWFDWGERGTGRINRNRFLSGQFVFTLGEWTDEVRQDPDHYYWGEEFALALRSFTHGYDFFLPDEIVAWHMLHTNGPPRRHWENGQEVVNVKNKIAFSRLHQLAYSKEGEDLIDLGRYGLGDRRSRGEFETFTGMDLANKVAHPDVYEGRCPDPVTIKHASDWSECVTLEDYLRQKTQEMSTKGPLPEQPISSSHQDNAPVAS